MRIAMFIICCLFSKFITAQLWHNFYNPEYYINNSIVEIYATHVRLNGSQAPPKETIGIIYQYDSATKTICESHMNKKMKAIPGTGVYYTTDEWNILHILENKNDIVDLNSAKSLKDTSIQTEDGYWRIYNEVGLIVKDSGSWENKDAGITHNVSNFYYNEKNRLDSIRTHWYVENTYELLKTQNVDYVYDENKFVITKTTIGETASNWGNVGIEIYQYNENLLLISKSFKNLYGSELYGYTYEYKFK